VVYLLSVGELLTAIFMLPASYFYGELWLNVLLTTAVLVSCQSWHTWLEMSSLTVTFQAPMCSAVGPHHLRADLRI
jgi:hypothetical protein